jgi:hypothetical protein
MLQKILTHIHKWFTVSIETDTFTIADGSIDCQPLQNGQYFRITGSVFNDGLHQWPAENLIDETFEGNVWALAVPNEIIELSNEIAEWVSAHPENEFTSESFGGYSYSKDATKSTWQGAFASQLRAFKKVSE